MTGPSVPVSARHIGLAALAHGLYLAEVTEDWVEVHDRNGQSRLRLTHEVLRDPVIDAFKYAAKVIARPRQYVRFA